jgi:hypothetical protein
MKEIQRVSPVVLKSTPIKTEKRDNWDVVMEYKGETDGPYLVDLSHRPRFDLQDADLSGITPFGMTIPGTPGQSLLENGVLANRMNRTQVSLFNLDGEEGLAMPAESGYTDVTESTICVALIGKETFSICEKLTALDFMESGRTTPFLFQGPFSHVPCQIVTLSRDGDKSGIVLTCSRGYGRDMIHSILHAGEEFKLVPAGEKRFTTWINSL